MGWLDRLLRRKPETKSDAMAIALAAAQACNYSVALSIWGPLAQAGVARAQNNIGACFAEGLGVIKNMELARAWLRLAAEGGDPVGQRNYAAFHMQDEFADLSVAADFYRRGAENNDAPSQDMLSWMLLEGEVLPFDAQSARLWAEKAAEAGIVSSMTRLGLIYHNATGVDRDSVKAVHWWRIAANLGDADAQAMLGAALNLGQGVERDGIAALGWLIRARSAGSELAKPFVGPVRGTLSSKEIAEAERRAALPLLQVAT